MKNGGIRLKTDAVLFSPCAEPAQNDDQQHRQRVERPIHRQHPFVLTLSSIYNALRHFSTFFVFSCFTMSQKNSHGRNNIVKEKQNSRRIEYGIGKQRKGRMCVRRNY